MEYLEGKDIGLIKLAQQGNQMAYTELIEKYEKYCVYAIEGLYTHNGKKEDLMQSCRIALYKAIATFDEDKGTFIAYAKMCIKSAAIDAIKKYNRKNQRILSFSLDINNTEIEQISYTENFENLYINENIVKKIKLYLNDNFDQKDNDLFLMYIEGYTYSDMAKKLNITNKNVDNIVQKIKKKLKKEFKDYF